MAASIADHGRGAKMSRGGQGHRVANHPIRRAVIEGRRDAHWRRGVYSADEASVRRRNVTAKGHSKAKGGLRLRQIKNGHRAAL